MDSCAINKSIYNSLPRFGHRPLKPAHHVLYVMRLLFIENFSMGKNRKLMCIIRYAIIIHRKLLGKNRKLMYTLPM